MSYTTTNHQNGDTDIGSYFCDLTNDQSVGGVKTFSANTTLKNITVIGDGNTTNYSGTIKCGAINGNGSITTNNNSLSCGTGAITCAGISCTTINTNSNTISCAGISCSTINTNNNTITCGSGSVTCGNLTVATSATFSGNVTVPSVDVTDNSTKAATTAKVKSYVDTAISNLSLGNYATTASLGSYAALSGAVFTGALTMAGAGIEIYDAANAYIDFKNDPAVDNHARIILYNKGDLNIQADKSIVLGQTTYCNNWFRVTNNNYGIYWQVGQGGWYMTDTTYMRCYGNKTVLSAKIQAENFTVSSGGYIDGVNGNAMRYYSSNGGNHVFITDDIERFRVGNGGITTGYALEAGVISITGYGDTGTTSIPRFRPYTTNGDQGNTGDLGTSVRYCLWAKGYGGSRVLIGTEVDVYSDIRIKKNIECLDRTYALNSIRKIKPVSYCYIQDSVATEIGFIAQETEKYIPESVKNIQEAIPNILSHGNVTKINDDTYEILLDNNFDSTTIFYFPVGIRITCGEQQNDDYSIFEIKIVDEKQCLIIKRNKPDSLELNDRVFVKGIFVNDFRVLAKNVVFTYAVSALQQVDVEVQELKKENQLLRSEIQTINSELNELKELVRSLINDK